MYPDAQQALDSIDRFIGVAEIANLPILSMPEYRAAANDLYQIAQKLLIANENMSRWLNRFLYFDFRAPDARAQFLNLVQDYRTTKAGRGFRDMKFSCGDIFIIYQQNIEGKIVEMFPQDDRAANEARRVLPLRFQWGRSAASSVQGRLSQAPRAPGAACRRTVRPGAAVCAPCQPTRYALLRVPGKVAPLSLAPSSRTRSAGSWDRSLF